MSPKGAQASEGDRRGSTLLTHLRAVRSAMLTNFPSVIVQIIFVGIKQASFVLDLFIIFLMTVHRMSQAHSDSIIISMCRLGGDYICPKVCMLEEK